MGYQMVDVNGESWQFIIGDEFVRFRSPAGKDTTLRTWDFLGMTELEWRRKLRDDHNPPEFSKRAIGLSPSDVAMYIRRNMMP